MNYSKHPQPTERIVDIVKRLCSFEPVRVKDMAQIHNVSEKSILRDLKKISEQIPLCSKRGVYRMDAEHFSHDQRLSVELVQAFAGNAGFSVECLGGSRSSIPLISFTIAYSSIDRRIAQEVITSIESGTKCRFVYTNNKGEISRRTVSPILLYTESGKWYLMAKDTKDGQIKYFDFLKIEKFEAIPGSSSDVSEDDIREAAKRSSVWASSNTEPYEVQIEASSYARRYLDEIPIHRTQKLISPHDDGGATYSYTITHPMELLPKVKEWIPHLHILSPDSLQIQLQQDIEKYLDEMG